MKLAEALQERADLNRKIAELQSRITRNAVVQEGSAPSEDIGELKQELDAAAVRLTGIIAEINLTNASVRVNGKTLTELIAEKDILKVKISAYKDVTNAVGGTYFRSRGTELRTIPTISVSEWQKEIDRMSGELRRIDNLLQETNWKTELI